jgi:hypothetical protein
MTDMVAARLDFLRANQNSDGGWGYFPGRESRVESTVHALRALGGETNPGAPGIRFLLSRQDRTGGLTPSAAVPGATWVTQLAFPLLRQAGVEKKVLETAADWIVSTQGAEDGLLQRLLYAMGKAKEDQNPRFKGWPWRPDNSSWVEPTAWGLIALPAMEGVAPPAALTYRRQMAVRMLLDRRCEDGGWNYGNKRVLGEVLPSYPETTAIALIGLAAAGQDLSKQLAPSFERAEAGLATSSGAYARALLALALRLHGRKPSYAPEQASIHPSRNIMLTALEVLALEENRKALLP